MDKNGINGLYKSHTQTMEKQTELKKELTKADEEKGSNGGVTITTGEAMEYREYKRQKKRAEILAAIAASEGVLSEIEDARRVSERAVRLRQAAVRMSLERLEQSWEIFVRNSVIMDCVVGGNGETLAKVKAYEAKTAKKRHAREITLLLSPFAIASSRFTDIKKELKKVRKATAKLVLKVCVEKQYPMPVLSRLARLTCEAGAQYFCVPVFDGCERLRIDLSGGCKLQVSGVETLEEYKKLVNAGVGRVVTERGWEIYTEWMREVEKINFPELLRPAPAKTVEQKPTEKTPPKSEELIKKAGEELTKRAEAAAKLPLLPTGAQNTPNATAADGVVSRKSDNDYQCCIEGGKLKFL